MFDTIFNIITNSGKPLGKGLKSCNDLMEFKIYFKTKVVGLSEDTTLSFYSLMTKLELLEDTIISETHYDVFHTAINRTLPLILKALETSCYSTANNYMNSLESKIDDLNLKQKVSSKKEVFIAIVQEIEAKHLILDSVISKSLMKNAENLNYIMLKETLDQNITDEILSQLSDIDLFLEEEINILKGKSKKTLINDLKINKRYLNQLNSSWRTE